MLQQNGGRYQAQKIESSFEAFSYQDHFWVLEKITLLVFQGSLEGHRIVSHCPPGYYPDDESTYPRE